MKCRILRAHAVASGWGATVVAIVALAGSSTFAQSRGGALGAGGIGLVGRSQGSLFSVPGHFAFDNYTVGADQFLNQRRPVNNRLLSVSLSGVRRPDSSLTGRTVFGGAPGFYVPGVADLRRPGARYVLPRPVTGPGLGPTADPFGVGGTATVSRMTSITPYTPNGRIVPAPPSPFLFSMTGTDEANPLFYDALTNPQSSATGQAFAPVGGMAPNRLRELENAATFAPGAQPDGPVREDRPVTDALDAFAARRRAKFESYIDQAWAQFRSGNYQRAAATFGLASQADASETEAVRGRLYSALLIERFTVARALFDRLLRDDANLFNRPGDLSQRFDDPAEYRAFVARLRTHAEGTQASPMLVALYAYTLWQHGETFNARAMARRAAGLDARSPYALMIARMEAESSSPVAPNRPSVD